MAVVRLSYTPAEAGATVTAVRIYTEPARTGTPAASGVPVLASGVWTFSPDLTDGDYYTAWDVTDSTGSYTDGDDFFYVLFGEVVENSQVIGLAQVRTQLGLTDKRHDGELIELVAASVRAVEEWCGPILPRTVTETLTGTVLAVSPVLSVTTILSRGVAYTGNFTLNGPAGTIAGAPSGAVVTYVAGRSPIPANIRRAVLRHVAWSWRRDHGGSETYMPGGDDAVPGLGVAGIEKEIAHILGPDRRGMRVA